MLLNPISMLSQIDTKILRVEEGERRDEQYF